MLAMCALSSSAKLGSMGVLMMLGVVAMSLRRATTLLANSVFMGAPLPTLVGSKLRQY